MAVDNRFAQDSWRRGDGESPGIFSEIVTGPVFDWATDFSHLEPEWAHDPYPIQDDLRQRCPIAHTDRFGRGWLPTRYEDVAAIAHEAEHFSSRSIIMGNFRPLREIAPIGGSPPITSDPPFHHAARKLLVPAFTKAAASSQELATRALCHSLIDAFEGCDVVDAASDYAQHIPMRVIANMLGFPPQDGPQFREFIKNRFEEINLPQRERVIRMSALFHYLLAQVHDHLDNPRDDLTIFLINAELCGRKLQASHIVGSMTLLLIAGIDTMWSAIGASLWHLASNPEDRRRLIAEPGLLSTAVEEFLRAYAPVTMARLVTQDMHSRGVDMKADDWILLSFPAANRDPAQFDRADQAIIDRQINRHAAFGLGIRRCLGSHPARMELRVALQVWLERIPDFSLDNPSAVTWSTGQVRGPSMLPLRIRSGTHHQLRGPVLLPAGEFLHDGPADRVPTTNRPTTLNEAFVKDADASGAFGHARL